MHHIRDKKRWFAAHFGRQVVNLPLPGYDLLPLGIGMLIALTLMALFATEIHAASTGASLAIVTSLALKEERNKLVADARKVWEDSKNKPDAAQLETIRNLDTATAALDDKILLAEKLESREAKAQDREPHRVDIESEESAASNASDGWLQVKAERNPLTNMHGRKYSVAKNTEVRGSKEYRKAFSSFMKNGKIPVDATPAIKNALQAESDTAGGYTVAPQQFIADLIQAVDDQLFIRGLATVTPVAKAESVGRPSLDADPADTDWTSELATGSEDSTMAFGKRELHPHPLAKLIKVSNKLLRASAIGIDALVIQRLSYKFAVTQEKGFLTGNGANQPLGLFTASSDGISTSRDVSTGNTTTAIGADGLIEALYTLKSQYQMRASWIFHRSAVKQIRKLKDGNGQYMWQAGVGAGQPDRILDKPFYMSEYAPSTFTTGLYVGIVGDYSFYWIADALSLAFQRLVELYAVTNQTGYIGRMETDAMPVLEEAFVRVKLA